jgi:hypothetical protein
MHYVGCQAKEKPDFKNHPSSQHYYFHGLCWFVHCAVFNKGTKWGASPTLQLTVGTIFFYCPC